MAESECWNCSEALDPDWNYCPNCTYPVDPDIMLQKMLTWKQKEKHMVENASELLAEGMKNRFTEEELQTILEESD